MSCCNSIRRRLVVISAAIAYAAVTTASTQQASAHAALYTTSSSSPPPSPHHSNNDSDDETILMVPTFSCGSQWQSATQCNQLCIDGNDSSCPTGQYCYAGIPCSKLNVEEAALRMEAELMERLIRERDVNSVKGFVCGVTFEEAESSCSSGDGGRSARPVHYCYSGQSSECPSNMQCFASVACSSSGSSSSPSSFSSSPQQQQQQQPITSFSSPTANVTLIIHENDDDEASLSYYYYSFNNIVDTMGSKLVEFAGSTFTFGMLRQ